MTSISWPTNIVNNESAKANGKYQYQSIENINNGNEINNQ